MKEKEELWRFDCLGDRGLDDLNEGAHAKMINNIPYKTFFTMLV